MYFDTLKVSTLEQTAEQTSARGGLGNPELIIWDYGKEISVTLEDALFSPASQSLMWGGKFGTKSSKIKGVWNPIEFDTDKWGRRIYLNPIIAEATIYRTDENGYPSEDARYQIIDKDGNIYPYKGNPISTNYIWNTLLEEDGWVEFICPCDNQWKKVKYIPADSHYKYLSQENKSNPKEDQLKGYALYCPNNFPIYEKDDDTELSLDMRQNGYYSSELLTTWFDINNNNSRAPEKAEIIVENFGKFDFKNYKYSAVDRPESISETDEPSSKLCVSEEIDSDTFSGNAGCSCSSAHGYIWEDTDLKMTSLEGNMDIYYSEGASIKYRVPTDSQNKQVMVARRKLYLTQFVTADPWDLDGNPPKEVEDFIDLTTRQETSGKSYGWVVDAYESKVDFYVNVTWTVPTVEDGESLNHMTRVKVGTFYIIADWNAAMYSMEDLIYPINSGLEDVYVLERMEKCKASQTFAINTDRNIKSANYRYMPEYSQADLVVFIDPKTMKPFEANSDNFMRKNGTIVTGNLRIIKQNDIYYKWTRTRAPKYTSLGHRITVDATHFPGTYRLVGETYARSRDTGKDQRYQFEIPLCKMSSENNLTLEAAGDPTTFTMTLKVLRKEDGTMMKLTQYNVDCQSYDGYKSGSTKIIPISGVVNEDLSDLST